MNINKKTTGLAAGRPSVNKQKATMEDAPKLARVNFQVFESELEKLKIYAAKNKKSIREIMTDFIATLPD